MATNDFSKILTMLKEQQAKKPARKGNILEVSRKEILEKIKKRVEEKKEEN
jgi:hypothetical protein